MEKERNQTNGDGPVYTAQSIDTQRPSTLGTRRASKEGENTRSILLAKDVVEYSYNPKRFL